MSAGIWKAALVYALIRLTFSALTGSLGVSLEETCSDTERDLHSRTDRVLLQYRISSWWQRQQLAKHADVFTAILLACESDKRNDIIATAEKSTASHLL